MAEWVPVFVLPNVSLEDSIECDIAALVPTRDRRVTPLKREHPRFKRFLNRFADSFGQKFEPTVLIINKAAAPVFRDISALASFRDLIAICAITRARALEILYPRGHRVSYGDSFSIYPWMLDRHYHHLIGNTPAILATHEVSSFKGQSSPTISRMPLGAEDIDQSMLIALMARWQQCHETSEPAWADVALLRSLNMAYHASLLPAGTDTTIYDVGRIISLWVSAFEILVHPGGNGRVHRDNVFDLIERTPWAIPASGRLTYETGGKTKVLRTLASWLYQELYERRNDFLHGNPVEYRNLNMPTPQRWISDYAAPLYRIALTAFLDLTHTSPVPSTDDSKGFGAFVNDQMNFMEPQKKAEKALLTAMPSRLKDRSDPSPIERKN